MIFASWFDEFPHLREEWSTSNTIDPTTLTRGSNKKVSWTCADGHTWEAVVKSRTTVGSGCPYCSGRLVITGKTDLATLYPEVAALWSPTNELTASKVTSRSHKKSIWRCPVGHEWINAPAQQVLSAGCPQCSKYSTDESSGYDVATLFPELAKDWSPNNKVPAGKHAVNRSKVEWVCHTCSHVWKAFVDERAEGKGCPVCTFSKLVSGVNDFATTHPAVVVQLCGPDDFDPSTVMHKSQEIVRWRCAEGHEFDMSVRYKCRKEENYCPDCKKLKTVERKNASRRKAGGNGPLVKIPLAETHPELAQEWSPNNVVSVDDVSRGSHKIVKWICFEGHEFEAAVNNRVSGWGCPFCSGRKVLSGATDLATTYPELAAQWSSSNKKKPTEVHANSAYIAAWNMSCGHTMTMPVKKHVQNPNVCSVCNGKQVMVGVNDLATTDPELISQWHKDNDKKPSEVSRGSGYKAKWTCDKGHVWITPVTYRATSGSGCPFCSNNEVLKGFNDLSTTHPNLAAQWHYSNELSACDVTAGSNRQVKWICDKGHEWEAQILQRMYGVGCPYCAGKKVDPGVTDLAAKYPQLVPEWHPSKNGTLLPSQVMNGSRKRVWWLGACGHEWEATILNRRNGSGCPKCSNAVSKMEKDVLEFVKSCMNGVAVEGSNRKVLDNRRELDIYIPSLKTAIEFNGLYWHSDAVGKPPTYHYEKYRDCAALGVRLIQIWEDDWRDRRTVVENMLRTRLGVSGQRKLNARSLNHRRVSYSDVENLFSDNHIQGPISGTFYDSLVESDGTVVAALVTTKTDNEYRIDRYATAANVRGGFGKLLKVLESRVSANGGGKLVTFADLEISNGDLYRSSGFIEDVVLPPDYKYMYGSKRCHKFGFRKDRFKSDTSLKYASGLTEHQLAKLNGIPRIYDSGKIRFVKEVPAI